MIKKILYVLSILMQILLLISILSGTAWFIGIVCGRTTTALDKIENLEENCYDINYYVINIDKKIDQLQEKINNAQK